LKRLEAHLVLPSKEGGSAPTANHGCNKTVAEVTDEASSDTSGGARRGFAIITSVIAFVTYLIAIMLLHQANLVKIGKDNWELLKNSIGNATKEAGVM
jgi:hypothetical protein